MQLYVFKTFNEQHSRMVGQFFLLRTIALLASFGVGLTFGLNAWLAFVAYAIASFGLHVRAISIVFRTERIRFRLVEGVIASVMLLLSLPLWLLAGVIAREQVGNASFSQLKAVFVLLALAKLFSMHADFLIASALQRAFASPKTARP